MKEVGDALNKIVDVCKSKEDCDDCPFKDREYHDCIMITEPCNWDVDDISRILSTAD